MGQNGTRPGFRAIQHGECALGALEGQNRFWLLGRDVAGASEAAPLLRAFAQVPWKRAACAMANFHCGGRCLPPPPQTPMGRDQSVCAQIYPWASPGGPIEWLGRLKFVPTPEEGDFGILEAARPDLLLQDPMASGPPPAWAPRRVRRGPGIDYGLPSRVRRSQGMLCTDLGAVVCVSFRPAVGRGGNQPTQTRTYRGRARRTWLVGFGSSC